MKRWKQDMASTWKNVRKYQLNDNADWLLYGTKGRRKKNVQFQQ